MFSAQVSDVFDIGFTEMALIGVMALVVVGPERLPKLARTAGLYMGRARRMLTDVKRDIDREINQAELSEFKDIKNTIDDARSEISEATRDVSDTLNREVDDIQKSVKPATGGDSATGESKDDSAGKAAKSEDPVPGP